MPEDSKSQSTQTAQAAGSVGQQLKARRQALRMSLAQVEVATKIRGKYLTALEAGDNDVLPNDIYSRGFVQHYGNHLGLEGAKLAAAYVKERGGVQTGSTKTPKLERPKQLVFTGRVAALIGLALAVAGIISYLLWQFSALAGAPRLTVSSPAADQAITGSIIDIRGKTTPGCDVTINGSPVLTDANGGYAEKLALQDGVNEINVSSRSKLGKVSTVTRNILATLPRRDPQTASVPTSVFDGIAVAMKVRETTSVVVVVDGKEAWRGIVVAGWNNVFTGKDTVSITTGNAGATSLEITNRNVVNKKIESLGKAGEIRRGQDFAKDTVIP